MSRLGVYEERRLTLECPAGSRTCKGSDHGELRAGYNNWSSGAGKGVRGKSFALLEAKAESLLSFFMQKRGQKLRI